MNKTSTFQNIAEDLMRMWNSGTGTARRSIALCISAAGLMASLGCRGAVSGDWKMIEVVPNKEIFDIDNARFNSDGSYSATSTIEGKTVREVGTYEFNGYKLTLRPQAGGQRRYDASLRFNQLEIIDGKRKVVLKKS